jgi:hypothetical protein
MPVIIAWLAFLFFTTWGCLLNIVDLITGWASMDGVEVAIRIAGLFIPVLGAFFGWF